MSQPEPVTPIDAYIASCPEEVQGILREIRATVRKAAPQAEERISYRMPAFFQDGVLVYFAAFKRHIGVFPPVTDAKLIEATAQYAGPKGNLQFPLNEKMPLALIGRIVKARLKANRQRKTARRSSPA